MLATVMNALALEHAIEKKGHPARALSAVPMPYVCQPYSRQAALNHLAKGRVVVLAGGTGNPFFTTDTGAALRAAELSADAVLKATQVDGVYSADPKKDPTATRYERLTHDEAIARTSRSWIPRLSLLRARTAIPIIVFSIAEPRRHHRCACRAGAARRSSSPDGRGTAGRRASPAGRSRAARAETGT